MRDSRPVYQTGKGRVCPKCGWPADDCHCSSRLDQPLPAKLSCVLRLEKKGRGGKTRHRGRGPAAQRGLPRARSPSELKRACGTGGTAADDSVEIQGDQRERLRPLLAARGWVVKG